MKPSVVVPTLNDRDQLAACLDALAASAPTAEVIVVDGPSADGTTGMVCERDDVATLVQIAERNLNVARNAGLSAATGDVVALLGTRCRPDEGWFSALESAMDDGATVVTGPIEGDDGRPTVERRTIASRAVTYVNGDNVAFRRSTLEALDGFDEYLETGGARDVSHRLAGIDVPVTWEPSFSVDRVGGPDEPVDRDWGTKYRSLAYRLAKNYGPRPTVFARTGRHAAADALAAGRRVASGEVVPSRWIASGRDVLTGAAVGFTHGVRARLIDRTTTRNPNGLSSRNDRAVDRYDLR